MDGTNRELYFEDIDMMAFMCPMLYPLIAEFGKHNKEKIKQIIVDYALSDDITVDMFNIVVIEEVCKNEGLSKWYKKDGGVENHLMLRMLTENPLSEDDKHSPDDLAYKKYPKDFVTECFMAD